MLLKVQEERVNMVLGKVVSCVWGAKQTSGLDGFRILGIRPVGTSSEPGCVEGRICTDNHTGGILQEAMIVAVDTLGAGVGEYVIVGNGSRVRTITVGDGVPVKTIVLGIIDQAFFSCDRLCCWEEL